MTGPSRDERAAQMAPVMDALAALKVDLSLEGVTRVLDAMDATPDMPVKLDSTLRRHLFEVALMIASPEEMAAALELLGKDTGVKA